MLKLIDKIELKVTLNLQFVDLIGIKLLTNMLRKDLICMTI